MKKERKERNISGYAVISVLASLAAAVTIAILVGINTFGWWI